jgi:hypothetical protein
MNKLYFLILMCLGTSSAFSQSKAGASASATIVSPVGAELTSDVPQGYSTVKTKSRIINASSGKQQATTKLSAEHTITSVASIKIIGSTNVYDVSVQNNAVILRNADNETIAATVSSGKPYSAEGGVIADKNITISAAIDIKASQAKGYYASAAPYAVTINYN